MESHRSKPKPSTSKTDEILIQTPLPPELWRITFGFLRSNRDLVNAKLTCAEFNNAIKYNDNQLLKRGRDYTQQPSVSFLHEVDGKVESILFLPNGHIAMIRSHYAENQPALCQLILVDSRGEQKQLEPTIKLAVHRLVAALPNSNLITLEKLLSPSLHIWSFKEGKNIKTIPVTMQDQNFHARTSISGVKVLSQDSILTISDNLGYCQRININTGEVLQRNVDLNIFGAKDHKPIDESADHLLSDEIKKELLIKESREDSCISHNIRRRPDGDLVILAEEKRHKDGEYSKTTLYLYSYPRAENENNLVLRKRL